MWLSEIFDRAFRSIKENYRAWFLLAVISTVISAPTTFVGPPHQEFQDITLAGYSSVLLALILNILIAPGIIAMGLAGANGQKIELDQIIKKVHLALRLLGLSILYGIAVAAGLIALVIPGIYLMIRFGFAPLVMVENEKIGVFDAMKESTKRAKGNHLNIFFNGSVTLLVSLIIMIIASLIVVPITSQETTAAMLITNLIFILPTSVFIPITYIGWAVMYHRLRHPKNQTK